MIYTVSITSQGQVSIPAPIRRKLGLNGSKKALLLERGGKVVIEPIVDLLTLKGSLKTDLAASPKQIREKFEQYLANKSKLG